MVLLDRQSKFWLFASWLVYTSVLFLFASIYFKERTLFLDNSFLLFRLIQDDGIVINAYRWPAAIYRVLPYLALKLGLSLKTLMLGFSLSYVLIPVVIQGYISLHQKNLSAIVIFGFLTSTILAHGFFWNNSELFLSIQFIFFLAVCIDSNKTLLSILLSVFIAWLHPLSLLAFGFLFCLKCISGNTNKALKLAGIVFGLNYTIKLLFFPNWYDNTKKLELLNNIQQLDQSIFSSLLNYLMSWDYLLFAGFILLFAFLIIKRQYKQLGLLSVFTIISLFLFVISDPKSSLEFYNELNNYIFFLFLALCIMELKPMQDGRYVLLATTILLVFASFRWINTAKEYSQRIQWYQDKLEHEDRIIYINPSDELNHLVLEWASAYESLLISSMESKNSKSILFTNNHDKSRFEGDSELLITEYRNYNLDSLDKNYFKLEKKPYEVIYLD